MTQEEKDLLLKYLCATLPYGVKYCREYLDYERDQEMCAVGTLESIDKDGYINDTKVYTVWDIKPYLRQMSSMTEEEKEEIKAFGAELSSIGSIRFRIKEDENDGFEYGYQWLDILDFLNANHFDYRDLIPMGIALEAPEGMYNTKTE